MASLAGIVLAWPLWERRIDPSIPAPVEAAVLAALAKKPGDRPTAEQLASLLAGTGPAFAQEETGR